MTIHHIVAGVISASRLVWCDVD